MIKTAKKTTINVRNDVKLETNKNDNIETSTICNTNVEDKQKIDKSELKNEISNIKFENSNSDNTYANRDFFFSNLNLTKNKKRHNLIVFGAVQSKALTTEERIKEDNGLISNVLKSIGMNQEDKIVKIERLISKQNSMFQPPIIIEFNNMISPMTILRSAKLLKQSNEFKHISISPDLLKKERVLLQKMIKNRNELNSKLKVIQPDAQYYYGIRSDKIVMISKDSNKKEISSDNRPLHDCSTKPTQTKVSNQRNIYYNSVKTYKEVNNRMNSDPNLDELIKNIVKEQTKTLRMQIESIQDQLNKQNSIIKDMKNNVIITVHSKLQQLDKKLQQRFESMETAQTNINDLINSLAIESNEMINSIKIHLNKASNKAMKESKKLEKMFTLMIDKMPEVADDNEYLA